MTETEGGREREKERKAERMKEGQRYIKMSLPGGPPKSGHSVSSNLKRPGFSGRPLAPALKSEKIRAPTMGGGGRFWRLH